VHHRRSLRGSWRCGGCRTGALLEAEADAGLHVGFSLQRGDGLEEGPWRKDGKGSFADFDDVCVCFRFARSSVCASKFSSDGIVAAIVSFFFGAVGRAATVML